jgi:uncharacterized integral membrane protein
VTFFESRCENVLTNVFPLLFSLLLVVHEPRFLGVSHFDLTLSIHRCLVLYVVTVRVSECLPEDVGDLFLHRVYFVLFFVKDIII